MARLTTNVSLFDEFGRSDASTLGTADLGGPWKGNTANFGIVSGAAVKATGTSTIRYINLLTCAIAGDITLDANIRTSPTTNTTDLGFVLRALDNPNSRGGQLYVSLRKTATANSVRVMHRANTSGSDTVLAQNTTAGWVDGGTGTAYNIKVKLVGKTIDVLRDGVSVMPSGVPYTIADAVLSTLGTDVGITFTNTDVGSRIEDFFVVDPNYVPPSPTPTNTQFLAHRGLPLAEDDIYEESIFGLTKLPGNINGPEVDARKPTDSSSAYYLMHDPTSNRTNSLGGTNFTAPGTVAQYQATGMTSLAAYLAACEPYGYRTIIVQAEMDIVSDMLGLVAICKASPLRDRILIMTSATAGSTPRHAELRTAGWTGRLGCYGLTVANWSTYAASFAASNVSVIFLALGDTAYDANVALIDTAHAAGFQVGASTITPARFADAISRGVEYILTDYPAEAMATYAPPPNGQVVNSTFSGSGTFSATVVPRSYLFVDFTASGAFSATITPNSLQSVGLSGTGAFSATIKPNATLNAPFSGTGGFAASLTSVGQLPANFTGSGTFSATIRPNAILNANFAGSGAFSAIVVPNVALNADFFGSGRFSVVVEQGAENGVYAWLEGQWRQVATLIAV